MWKVISTKWGDAGDRGQCPLTKRTRDRITGNPPGKDSKKGISRYLDEGLTVVILTNQGNCDPHLIADEVAAIYFAKRSPL